MMLAVFRIFKHTKVENTRKPPEVCLCSLCREKHSFVCLSGKVRILLERNHQSSLKRPNESHWFVKSM